MTTGEAISKFAIDLAPAVGSLALAALTYVLARAAAWIKGKTKNDLVIATVTRLNDAVLTETRAAEQTVVAALKAKSGGTLTKEDAEKIKADVLAQVRDHFGGDKKVAVAQKILGVDDIEKVISAKIEAAVHALSAEAAPASPVAGAMSVPVADPR